jgi:uncharacterized membrane protein YeaQ/YmgE (transglycosylase-associated protein family)
MMRQTIGAQRSDVQEAAVTHYLVAMGLFGILGFAIFGLIIGALAKFFMPGKDPGGFWITMLLGMAGSVIATWILQAMGHYQEGQRAGWIASFFGAILLLLIYRMIRGRSA